MKLYRYRDNRGTTRHSLSRMRLHLHKVGTLQCIRAYVYRSKYAYKHAILVRGTRGSARFSGFNFGYGGEGPRGLRDLFKFLRIPDCIFEQIQTLKSPDWTKKRDYWKLTCQENCEGYTLTIYNEENYVVKCINYNLDEYSLPIQLRLC